MAHLYESNGYRYLSVLVDLFSRKVWVRPLKTKTPKEVELALQEVLDDGVDIQTFSSDRGGEYVGLKKTGFFKRNKIRFVPKVGPSKAYMAEHFIFVLKKRLYTLMRSSGLTEWEKLVSTVCQNLNNSASPVLGNLTPASINNENEYEVRQNRSEMGSSAHLLNWKEQQSNIVEFEENLDKQPLKIGDYVYKIQQKEAFQKSHDT